MSKNKDTFKKYYFDSALVQCSVGPGLEIKKKSGSAELSCASDKCFNKTNKLWILQCKNQQRKKKEGNSYLSSLGSRDRFLILCHKSPAEQTQLMVELMLHFLKKVPLCELRIMSSRTANLNSP